MRLPSHPRYEAQVEKEQEWLPRLGPRLPLPIPTPLALGRPTDEFPLKWSVYGWLEGETAAVARIDDPAGFAEGLADFLVAFQSLDPTGGPGPGPHNFHRGGPLTFYEEETLAALDAVRQVDDLDVAGIEAVWAAAVEAPLPETPRWLHGDMAPTNVLVKDGRLHAVIDFGICGVGDPSCDLKMAWTFFDAPARVVFRERLGLDGDTWARARGWALWKQLKGFSEALERGEPGGGESRRFVDAIVTDHREFG